MNKPLTERQNLLAEYMSLISERCYSAGWLNNLEYVLWDTLSSGPRKYGHDFVTNYDIILLKEMSTEANSWIIFHDQFGETGIDLNEWVILFAANVNIDSSKYLEG